MAWQLNLVASDLAFGLVVPATPIQMMCKVNLLFLSGFLKLRVDVPVLRWDLSRMKVVRSAWDRVQDSIRDWILSRAQEPVSLGKLSQG
eukprot:1159832-Pelagomonas_calceolata.AAC.16